MSIDRSDSKMKQPLLEDRTKSGRAQSVQPPLKTICGLDANLIALSTMNFFQNAAISVIVPFFPPLASKIGVSQTLIGLILAFNPIGSFLVSLIVAQMMGRLGKKNLMFWGLIFQAITIASFGALSNLNSEIAFICLSILSRFIQGAARSAYGSSTFGYVPQLWPDSVQKKISIMETLTALGTILGPMIGQVLYTALGQQIPFYVLSFLFFCCLITVRWLPPDNRVKKDLTKVSSVKCLTNRYIFMTFLVLVGATTAQTYINTLYSKHMDNLGLDDDKSGYVFSVGSIFYMLFLHLMPKLSKYINRKIILTIGLFIAVIGTEFQAPEKYFGLPQGGNYWYLVTIGQCIINISFAMCVLPMIPELIELTVQKELKERNLIATDAKLSRACSDMSSGIFMAGYSLGLFIGPFGSGVLYDAFQGTDEEKFLNTSRCIAAFLLFVFILYLTAGGSYKGFISQKKLIRSLSKKSQKYNDDVIRERNSKAAIDPIGLDQNESRSKSRLLKIQQQQQQQQQSENNNQSDNNKISEVFYSSKVRDIQHKNQIPEQNENDDGINRDEEEKFDVHSDILLSDGNKDSDLSEGLDSNEEQEGDTVLPVQYSFEENEQSSHSAVENKC